MGVVDRPGPSGPARGAVVVSTLCVDAAVVLETTGDLSVLTGGSVIDPVVLAGVRGGELLR